MSAVFPPLRLLIAFDKFKGALTAREACELVGSVIRRARPTWQLDVAPLSDGGDGFCSILTEAAAGVSHELTASASLFDAAGQAEQLSVPIGIVELQRLPPSAREQLALPEQTERLAVLEMAAINGLALLPSERRDVWRASSYGTGELLLGAAQLGADAILLGVGGSATSDLGLGALCALGIRFETARGRALVPPLPASWPSVRRVRGEAVRDLLPLRIACDVDNPLLGPRGAAALYGAQKGLSAADLPRFEAEAARMLALVCEGLDADRALASTPGAGAAGGIVFGLLAGTGARRVPGFELVAAWLGLDARLGGCDLVITGEGRYDASSRSGKGPGAIALRARRLGRAAVVFAGSVEPPCESEPGCELVAISEPHLPLARAIAQTRENLVKAVASWLARATTLGPR